MSWRRRAFEHGHAALESVESVLEVCDVGVTVLVEAQLRGRRGLVRNRLRIGIAPAPKRAAPRPAAGPAAAAHLHRSACCVVWWCVLRCVSAGCGVRCGA